MTPQASTKGGDVDGLKLRFVRRWFIEHGPTMWGGSPVFGGKHQSVKTFKTVLQFQDESGEWKDVPAVDDEESLAEVRKIP